MSMFSLSPRNVAPNQTLAFSRKVTLPNTVALGAT